MAQRRQAQGPDLRQEAAAFCDQRQNSCLLLVFTSFVYKTKGCSEMLAEVPFPPGREMGLLIYFHALVSLTWKLAFLRGPHKDKWQLCPFATKERLPAGGPQGSCLDFIMPMVPDLPMLYLTTFRLYNEEKVICIWFKNYTPNFEFWSLPRLGHGS